ncbi:MAG: hypothetical protein AAF533_23295 [Acidobacteriota bacterium]
MRQRLISFTLATFLVVVPGSALAGVAEPEYVGIPYRLVTTEQGGEELVKLERQKFTYRSKSKLLGWAGSKTTYDIPGRKSPVRFKAGEPLRFVVRAASQAASPTALELTVLEGAEPGRKQRKAGLTGVRRAATPQATASWTTVTIDLTAGTIALLAKNHGESSFVLQPDGELPPGEYSLMDKANSTAFCFGVD